MTAWAQLAASGLIVPESALPPEPEPYPIAIDLFSGCGGFSLGFHQAGWHVIAAADMDVWSAMTYMFNLATPDVEIHFVTPDDEKRWQKAVKSQERQAVKSDGVISGNPGDGWLAHQSEVGPGCEHFFLGDVRKLTGEHILETIGLPGDAIGCVFGGPPCQGFSMAGRRDVVDPRNSLVFEFARLVNEIHPQALVMENVRGITSMVTPEGIPVVDALCHIFEAGGMGTYDALRRSLMGTSGAGGAVRGKPVGSHAKARKAEEAEAKAEAARPEHEQIEMFA